MRFAHQQEEYDRHKYDRARAYLWQMRTGKTRMTVESAMALYEALEINGVLVVAPNGVHTQWAQEQIKRWGGGANNTFAWRFANKNVERDFMLFLTFCGRRDRLHWLCVNMEVLIRPEIRSVIAQFKKVVGPAMLVADEAHHFARAGAKRTGIMRGLGRQFEYRRILTGTFSENSHRQVFTQCEILEHGALGHTTLKSFDAEFTKFDDVYIGKGKRIKKSGDCRKPKELKRRLARMASVVLRSDCEDLPPLQLDHRVVEMTEAQWKIWNAVKDKDLEALEALGQDRVLIGGAVLVKLQQVEGGSWQNRPIEGDNPKMLILLDEIMQYDSQVIAWFAYINELEAAMRALKEAKISCARFHGRVGSAERDKSLAQFRRNEIRVLLAQPQAGGEGRDMSAAGKILWYSQTPDAIVRSQANERATAMGGKSIQVVDILSPVSRYFRELTERKTTLADDLSRYGLRKIIEQLGRR